MMHNCHHTALAPNRPDGMTSPARPFLSMSWIASDRPQRRLACRTTCSMLSAGVPPDAGSPADGSPGAG